MLPIPGIHIKIEDLTDRYRSRASFSFGRKLKAQPSEALTTIEQSGSGGLALLRITAALLCARGAMLMWTAS